MDDGSSFSAKEKLHKCIREFQASLVSPFRMSDANKWVETYFKKEGGNLESVGIFIQFIQDLGIIRKVGSNVLLSKYSFDVERINELFGPNSPRQPMGEHVLNDCGSELQRQPMVTCSYCRELRNLFPRECEIVKEKCIDEEGALGTLQKTLDRLSELLNLEKDQLIHCLLQSGPGDEENNTKENDPNPSLDVALGFWIHHNTTYRGISTEHVTTSLTDAVTLACLDTLANWPEKHAHQLELCEGHCAPSLILSTAFASARTELEPQSCVPANCAALFELIVRTHPLEHLTSTFLKHHLVPDLPTPVQSGSAIRLPPLATPLSFRSIPYADDTCVVTGRSRFVRPRFRSFNVPSWDSSEALNDSYRPISIPSLRPPWIPSLRKTPENCMIQPSAPSPVHSCASPGHSNPSPSPSTMSTVADQLASLRISPRPSAQNSNSPQHVTTNPALTFDLECLPVTDQNVVSSIQLALCLIPPVLRVRIRLLMRHLLPVLRNHARLAPAFVSDGSTVKEHSVQVVSSKLAEFAAPSLFPLSSRSPVLECATGKEHWTVQLTRLLLADQNGVLFSAQVNSDVNDTVKKNASLLEQEAVRGPITSPLEPHLRRNSSRSNKTRPHSVAGSTVSLDNLIPGPHPIPLCIPAIASAKYQLSGTPPLPDAGSLPNWVASTPTDKPRAGRSFSAGDDLGCPGTAADDLCCSCPEHEHLSRGGQLKGSTQGARWRASSCTSGSLSSQSDLDPERLASLGRTAHLIRLLNQIIHDRQMDPRRKMKCLLAFQKAHTDVFWLRFRNEQTAADYFARLQRRIDALPQPTVLDRITRVLRRRRPSPVRSRSASNQSGSPC